MATVTDILVRKGWGVATIQQWATVLDAAQEMNRHRIGSLVVTEGEGVRGIITERDILTRVVAGERDPAVTRVAEVMTRELVCCSGDDSIDHVRELMQQRRVRHVPVLEGERLRGLVSIGDVNAWRSEAMAQTVAYLEDFVLRA